MTTPTERQVLESCLALIRGLDAKQHRIIPQAWPTDAIASVIDILTVVDEVEKRLHKALSH